MNASLLARDQSFQDMRATTSDVTAPLVSIVLCTWNRADLLAACLASLTSQEPSFVFEVIVVDDGSTDHTALVVQAATSTSRPRVRYVLGEHGGVNAARNRGLAAANGQIIMFFDDDQLAPPGYLEQMARRLLRDPGLAGVGGPCRDTRVGLRTCSRCSLADVSVPGQGVREVPRLLGGNMALRSEVFKEIGPFQEALSGRGDDNEWFHRAHGRRFLFDPELWVWHRRDHFGLLSLCKQAFRQGMAIPLSLHYQGVRYRQPRSRIPRALIHALAYRCTKGLWRASVDAGAIVGSIRIRCCPNRA